MQNGLRVISQNSNLNSNIAALSSDFTKASITSSFATSAVEESEIIIQYNKYFYQFPIYFSIKPGTYACTQVVNGKTEKFVRLYLFSAADIKKVFPQYDSLSDHDIVAQFQTTIVHGSTHDLAGATSGFLVKENSLNGAEFVVVVASSSETSMAITNRITLNLRAIGAIMK